MRFTCTRSCFVEEYVIYVIGHLADTVRRANFRWNARCFVFQEFSRVRSSLVRVAAR